MVEGEVVVVDDEPELIAPLLLLLRWVRSMPGWVDVAPAPCSVAIAPLGDIEVVAPCDGSVGDIEPDGEVWDGALGDMEPVVAPGAPMAPPAALPAAPPAGAPCANAEDARATVAIAAAKV